MKNFTFRALPLITILSALLFFSQGCKKETTETSSSTKASTTAVDTDGPIVLGAVFAMTGPIASYGQESMNGINLALEAINKNLIKGKKLKLILEDNKSDSLESANAVRKLINVDKVHVVIGSVASTNTLAGAPIAQEAGVPLLTPASTNEKVTQTGSFISRTCFTDAFQGVVMAKFAMETLKKKKAAVIIDSSSDYSKGLAAVFVENFKKMGGEIVEGDFSYVQKDTDFRSLLRKVKRQGPDVIFLPGYYTEVGNMLKQAREMEMNLPFLGGDGWDSPKLQELAGPEGIKGNYISSHFSPDDTDPKVQSFVKLYEETFKAKPGAMAALGYDAIQVVAEALKSSKSLNRSDIQAAIVATKGFEGITGSITIDENRNARKAAVVLETTATGMKFTQKVNP